MSGLPGTLRTSGPALSAVGALPTNADPDPKPRGRNHYATGTRFEHKTRDDLIANGYDVMRAAGSKGSTKIDLVAMKPGSLLVIQCKSSGTLPPAEWDRLVEVAGWVGAVPLLAANGPRGRGVVYTRLLGSKRRGCRTQPCEPWTPDEIAAAVEGGAA